MQATTEITSSPSLSSGFQVESFEISDEFSRKVNLDGSEEEVESDEEDFSFCLGADSSPISADDVFQNGEIKPIFPFFDQSLLDSVPSKDDLPRRLPVKHVFVESENSSSAAAGPFCEWSGKAVEPSPETCKKSNSTGFSKIWRFRDLLNRSSSDGKDAFVFLNGSSTTTKVEKSEGSSEKKAGGEAKAAAGAAAAGGGKVKVKKGGKGQTASLSAHELHYVRNRALREGDRRRSYLPYRPELVGFFTNVNGGLSRNVHPF